MESGRPTETPSVWARITVKPSALASASPASISACVGYVPVLESQPSQFMFVAANLPTRGLAVAALPLASTVVEKARMNTETANRSGPEAHDCLRPDIDPPPMDINDRQCPCEEQERNLRISSERLGKSQSGLN